MNASIEEFDIIENYFAGKISCSHENILLGPGDDCGVFTLPADHAMCISTDTLIAGTHFPNHCKPNVVAHRSLVANLSDLAAMGASPFAYTLALTLDSECASHTWLEPFSSTLESLGQQYDIALIGGNLARGGLSLTYTVMGQVKQGSTLQRDTAKVGDYVYVTGNLGEAAAGLEIVQSGNSFSTLKAKYSELVDSYYFPTPRIAIGQALQKIATAAIDISDGFASDLSHICKRSSVSAEVVLDELPLSDALISYAGERKAQEFAVSGGDDYELCFTAAPDQSGALAALSEQLKVRVTMVGQIVDSLDDRASVSLHDRHGAEVDLAYIGYRHFT